MAAPWARPFLLPADAGPARAPSSHPILRCVLHRPHSDCPFFPAPQEAVAILAHASSTHQQLGAALDALRYLVEPIDSANCAWRGVATSGGGCWWWCLLAALVAVSWS